MLAKVRGWQCRWPVAVWSMKLCLRKDLEQVLESYKPGGCAGCHSSGSHHPTRNTQTPQRFALARAQQALLSLLKVFSRERGCLTGCAHTFLEQRLCIQAQKECLLSCAGSILVRFYGERSLMWAREAELEEGALTPRHITDLQLWGRTRQKYGLTALCFAMRINYDTRSTVLGSSLV